MASAQRGKWYGGANPEDAEELNEPDEGLAADEALQRVLDTADRHHTVMDEEPDPEEVRSRETPSGWIGAAEWRHIVPAARCRECGRVTWKLSLSGGPQKLMDTKRHGPVHAPGCSKPPGRLDRELLK